MHCSARAVALATTLVLIACGGGDAPDTGAAAADAEAAGRAADGGGAATTAVNAFDFSAPGVTLAADLPTVDQLTLLGGCGPSGPLSIGVSRGSGMDDNYFYFAMDSVEPVSRGQTGDVELSAITFDNGVEAPRNMPDSDFRVPNRSEGTGTLTIESHTGAGMGGRMSGVVRGTVTDAGTGESVPIEVSFDINLACAMM